MIPSAYKIIVVVPVSEDRIACNERLTKLFSRFSKEVFAVLVDDGSVRTPMRASDGLVDPSRERPNFKREYTYRPL